MLINLVIAFCIGIMSWLLLGRFWAGMVLALTWMVLIWALRGRKGVK